MSTVPANRMVALAVVSGTTNDRQSPRILIILEDHRWSAAPLLVAVATG
jgi:hypothetical protein